MKKLVIGSAIALATMAAGCTTSDDTCDPNVENCGTCDPTVEDCGGDLATIGASWTVRTIDNPSIPCPPNGSTAALFNQRVDANGDLIGTCAGPNNISNDCFVDLFNCEDGSGVSSPLPAATWLTWIALTNDDGSQVYAKSLSAYLDVTDQDLDFHADIYDDGGYFSATWDLEAASDGSPVTCTEAGADSVSATVSSGIDMFDTNPWPCEDHYGVTPVIPEASQAYVVTVEALDSDELSLGKAPDYVDQSISGPNQVTALLPSALISIDSL
jgi:hypothetical protein